MVALFERSLGVGICLAVVLMLASCRKSGGANELPPVPVVSETVQTDPLQLQAELIGRLNGSANVEVRARVSGFVQEIAFMEGQKVTRGDVLLRIDPRPFEAALAQATAELVRMEALQKKAADDERRQKQLFEKKTISEQEYQNAVQASQAAKAAAEAARAAQRLAELNLEFATVIAPIDGVIGRTDFNEGDFLAAGSSGTPVATLSTLDPIDFEFSVSEAAYLEGAELINKFLDMPEADRPRDVTLILGDKHEHSEKGWVLAVDRALEATTGTIGGKARFPNPGGLLRPGQFARARFLTRKIANALTVSELAIVDMQGKSFVWVVDAEQKVSRRPVMIAGRVGGRAVIDNGLEPGERIVIEGMLALSEGRKIIETAPAVKAPASSNLTNSSGSAPEKTVPLEDSKHSAE